MTDCPVRYLEHDWPGRVWVLTFGRKRAYVEIDGMPGLIVFTDIGSADHWARLVFRPDCVAVQVSLETALDVVRFHEDRNICGVYLCDCSDKPVAYKFLR